MLDRVTKEKILTLYRALGGVAIQKRIAASFFLCTEFWFLILFPCEKARSPPLRFDVKKFTSEVKKGDIS